MNEKPVLDYRTPPRRRRDWVDYFLIGAVVMLLLVALIALCGVIIEWRRGIFFPFAIPL